MPSFFNILILFKCLTNSERAYLYRWIFAGAPMLVAFVACTVIMIIITTTVTNQTNQSNAYRNDTWRRDNGAFDDSSNRRSLQDLFNAIFPTTQVSVVDEESGVSARRRSNTLQAQAPNNTIRTSRSALRKQREVKQQAVCFILGFIQIVQLLI